MSDPKPVETLLAADIEISHICTGGGVKSPAKSLLQQLQGVPANNVASNGYVNVNDVGRQYDAQNGGCNYIDLDHLECCLPLCRGVTQFVTYLRAMRANVRDAVQRHNKSAGAAAHIEAMFDNRCGRGRGAVSIGTHLNMSVPAESWEEMCSGRYPAVTGFYGSALAGIQLVAGLGCVGSANRRSHADYQISQRADFINTLLHVDTMGHPFRSLVNARREPETGPLSPHDNPHNRNHDIALDLPLADSALFVTAGLYALANVCVIAQRTAPHLILHQPVRANWQWSHDPDLRTRAPLADGRRLTLPEYFAELVEHINARVVNEACVADTREAAEVISEAEAIAAAFLERRWEYLAPRVDWVQKRLLLEEVMQQDPALDWESNEIAMLDQLYASTDPETSLFEAQRRNGAIIDRIRETAVERARREPPSNTRSFGFTHLLRVLEASPSHRVLSVNWDRITTWEWGTRLPITVWFSDPTGATQSECGHLFTGAFSAREIVRAMAQGGAARLHALESRNRRTRDEAMEEELQVAQEAELLDCP